MNSERIFLEAVVFPMCRSRVKDMGIFYPISPQFVHRNRFLNMEHSTITAGKSIEFFYLSKSLYHLNRILHFVSKIMIFVQFLYHPHAVIKDKFECGSFRVDKLEAKMDAVLYL